MPTYKTKVRKDSGETIEQLVSVPQESQLGEYLSKIDGFVVDCSPFQASKESPEPKAEQAVVKPGNFQKAKASLAQISTFSWYMHTLTAAGVPLVRALSVVQNQMETPEWRGILEEIISCLEQGESFSGALQRFPRFFPTHFVHLMEVGETAGNLDHVLHSLALYTEKQITNRSAVKAALTYPIVLLAASTGVISFLVIFVLPKIANMFKNMSLELPLITKIMLVFGEFLKFGIPALVVLSPLALIGFRQFIKTPGGKRTVGLALLNTPIMGPLYKKYVIGRFCQTLQMLQESGVSLLVSMELARKSLSNAVLENYMKQVERNLREGAALGEEFAKSSHIPEMVSTMISVGEESGHLSEMLENVSRFYDRDIEQALKALPKVLEPVLIFVMTTVVGLIAGSIFIPLSKLTHGLK